MAKKNKENSTKAKPFGKKKKGKLKKGPKDKHVKPSRGQG